MLDGLYFEYPVAVVLLFVFIFCAQFCKVKLPSIYFPHTAQFMQTSANLSKVLLFLKWLSIVMLVVSLMSPVKDEPYSLEPKDGYEIALILDTSQSMQTKGFDQKNKNATRFDAIKAIVSNFITTRKDDNIGIVVFATYSFIASPLTYDINILRNIVSNLYIGMAGKFTSLYEALAQGVKLLERSKSKTKIAILLTDGYNTASSEFTYNAAVELAQKQGVKVYPIGIGASNEYNKEILQNIAKETGGVAFDAVNADKLTQVYKKINALETSEIDNESFHFLKYYFTVPLLISFFSLLLYLFLKNKKGYNS